VSVCWYIAVSHASDHATLVVSLSHPMITIHRLFLAHTYTCNLPSFWSCSKLVFRSTFFTSLSPSLALEYMWIPLFLCIHLRIDFRAGNAFLSSPPWIKKKNWIIIIVKKNDVAKIISKKINEIQQERKISVNWMKEKSENKFLLF
jgi:hypothetical protein